MMTRPLKVELAAAASAAASAAAAAESAVGPGAGFAPATAPPTPRAHNPALYDGDFDLGLAAFCRGAGVDPRSIGSEARNVALQLAGQLLREAVLGLMELNQARNEFRNRFRLAPSSRDGSESPLNLSQGVDEALLRLLTTVSTRAGSVDAIRENFRELKAHHAASLASTRAAFEEFLGRVDPKELEERFDRATKRSVFGAQNKGKYWDLYSEMFAGLSQRPAEGFPHVYTEAFAKAYEAKLRALIPPRRAAFGPDRGESTDAATPGDP
jgi:type VI secretion system FHA domain protein